MKKGTRSAAFLLSGILLASLATPITAAQEVKAADAPLRFHADGSFTVMTIADTQDTNRTKPDTITLIESALDAIEPDLVVLMGDNIAGAWLGARINSKTKAKEAIDKIVEPIDARGIPFALVFGNHDPSSPVPLDEQMKLYQAFDTCLAVDEGPSLTGCGTYRLPILSSANDSTAFNLWLFDSGKGKSLTSYSSPAADQINWYIKESQTQTDENGGTPIPGLAFQHVTVPEIYDTFSEADKSTPGAVKGWSTHSDRYWIPDPAYAPDSARIQNTRLLEGPRASDDGNGEFDAWLKQGDIIGAYFAHDHKNEYVANYKGIDLGYTPGAGFNSYGNGDERAVRVFELQESAPTQYRTHLIYYKDIVPHPPTTSWRDGMLGNYLNIGGPYALLALGCLAVACSGVILAIRIHQRKKVKRKKMSSRSSPHFK